MKKRIFVLLVTSPLIFTFYGCGSKSDGGNTKLNEGQNINEKKTETEDLETKEPSREQFLNDLNFLYRKMSNGKYEEARNFLKIPKSISTEEIESELNKSIENNEISAEGIAILSEKGSFGKLRDIFPERADKWLKESEVDNEENCFAMRFNQAEVAGSWNGKKFVFFRLDDVGKLAMSEGE
jgi:DNA-directed RNA polymerase